MTHSTADTVGLLCLSHLWRLSQVRQVWATVIRAFTRTPLGQRAVHSGHSAHRTARKRSLKPANVARPRAGSPYPSAYISIRITSGTGKPARQEAVQVGHNRHRPGRA